MLRSDTDTDTMKASSLAAWHNPKHQAPSGLGSLALRGQTFAGLSRCQVESQAPEGVFAFGLCIQRQGAYCTANGPCLGRTHLEMRLLTSQRVNLLPVSQEQSNRGDGRLAPVKGALEIEGRPYGCGSLKQMAEVGDITRLACLMEETEMPKRMARQKKKARFLCDARPDSYCHLVFHQELRFAIQQWKEYRAGFGLVARLMRGSAKEDVCG